MNKNLKVFQIHGLTGIVFLGFVLVGLFCGFMLFPIWVIMTGWNELVFNVFKGPSINYYQAALLWLFISLCFYLVIRNSISIKIHKTDGLESDNFPEIIKDFQEKDIEKTPNE